MQWLSGPSHFSDPNSVTGSELLLVVVVMTVRFSENAVGSTGSVYEGRKVQVLLELPEMAVAVFA